MNAARNEGLAHFAVTVISKDRPGIIADTAEVLYRLGCNLEDSSCTMLGGDFAIILIVSHRKPFPKSTLVEEFRKLHEEKGLAAFVRKLGEDEVHHRQQEGELCLVSVYGSDRPGIVFRVTRALADRSINITDLNTKLVGSEEEPVYVLMLEAVVPEGMGVEDVEAMLENLKKELNVEIGVRTITTVSL